MMRGRRSRAVGVEGVDWGGRRRAEEVGEFGDGGRGARSSRTRQRNRCARKPTNGRTTHDEGRRYLAGQQDSSEHDGRRCDDGSRMSMADVDRRISCQNTQSLFGEVQAKDGDAKTGAVAGRPGESEECSETAGAQGRR
jgi:hypothetical protein